MKFNQFLEKKGISEAAYKDKTVEEMASLQKEHQDACFDSLEKGLEGSAKKEEVSSLKDELKKSNDIIEELNGKVVKLSEKATPKGFVEGKMSKIFEENATKFKQNDRYWKTNTTIKAPALMTTANITPVVANGWSPLFNNYIDTDVASVPKPENFVLGLADVRTQAGAEAIYYSDRVNEEGDAQFIGEGTLKPLADAEWQTVKKSIKEVAISWKFTKRLMNHAPAVEADFREHANELMEQQIDTIALVGDEGGTPEEFDGVSILADPFVVPTELATYYPAANIYDVINAVATYVRLNNFRGQLTCVLNTVWKAKMNGIKDDNNNYILPPFVTPSGDTVGEVRVVFQNKMPESNILLGDIKKYKIIIAEDIEYDEGFENDDFTKNLVSRKLESFVGSYKKDSDAGSIIYDDIATILTAIDLP